MFFKKDKIDRKFLSYENIILHSFFVTQISDQGVNCGIPGYIWDRDDCEDTTPGSARGEV
jgi:hypothetical protein